MLFQHHSVANNFYTDVGSRTRLSPAYADSAFSTGIYRYTIQQLTLYDAYRIIYESPLLVLYQYIPMIKLVLPSRLELLSQDSDSCILPLNDGSVKDAPGLPGGARRLHPTPQGNFPVRSPSCTLRRIRNCGTRTVCTRRLAGDFTRGG